MFMVHLLHHELFGRRRRQVKSLEGGFRSDRMAKIQSGWVLKVQV